MRSERRCLLVCLLLLLTGMRDPFRPPDDRCGSAELTRWRYRGFVAEVGLMYDGKQSWYRVRQGEALAGWRVVSLDKNALVVEIGKGCEPAQWRWQREGEGNEKSRDNRSAADRLRDEPGSRTKTGHAGGG
ncbi:HofP DNA utilization family protein [Pseudenterobacter timonensis]|uniref:HofP DNA utilization family protein n=1 Tax=Pseudenterobacter timonensis TaxID=1755099 RepID=UPI00077B7D77|nr:HofP DNA utilization family protein [Pseudenterobacter timonensis]